jgi:hypothetical protein
MPRFASPKTAQILAERIANCEQSTAPVAQFGQVDRLLTDLLLPVET